MRLYEYSGVNAKIKALMGKTLGESEFGELFGLRTVNDIAAFLKRNTSYADALYDIDEAAVHRRELERNIYNALFTRCARILNFTDGNIKKIFAGVLLRFEINILKNIIRLINSDSFDQIDEIIELPRDYRSALDMAAIKESRTLLGFIDNLKGTIYYNVLKPFVTNTEHINLFNLENSLDMFYYSYMWRVKEKASQRDREDIEYLFGTEADLLNILNIYRFITYFNMPKELIYTHIIPYGKSLSKEQIKGLVESGTRQRCIEAVGESKYAGAFDFSDEYLDLDYERYINRLHKGVISRGGQSFGIMVAYVYVLEAEIKNIISVVEGIRYHLDSEELRKYII